MIIPLALVKIRVSLCLVLYIPILKECTGLETF